ncbi:MAG: hypothetical protein KGQ66_22635 [Acidobacteriota bacterium]|nr:hypothetical protein [Acidobacteriota bacterium]
MVRVGAYPGTFNPPTVAHLAIVEAALEQGGLDVVHLVVSRSPLGKDPSTPSFDERISVLETVAASRPWLEVRVTDHRLIADLAAGYDAVVMGMDKWAQVLDPVWYGGSPDARDAVVARLPRVLIARRDGFGADHGPLLAAGSGSVPPVTLLVVDESHRGVSSSLVRAGHLHLMLPEAAAFDARTGAWSAPHRYRRRGTGAPTRQGDPTSLPAVHDPGPPHA